MRKTFPISCEILLKGGQKIPSYINLLLLLRQTKTQKIEQGKEEYDIAAFDNQVFELLPN